MMNLNTKIEHPWFVDGHNITSVIANEGSLEWPQWKHIANCNYGYADPEKYFEENKMNAKRIAKVPTMIYLLKKTALTIDILRAQKTFIDTPELLAEIELCLKELNEL